jgi:hypothetical protein
MATGVARLVIIRPETDRWIVTGRGETLSSLESLRNKVKYSFVIIRTAAPERLELFREQFELDVLREHGAELHGILPDEQIELARQDGYEVVVMGKMLVTSG